MFWLRVKCQHSLVNVSRNGKHNLYNLNIIMQPNKA